MGQHSSMAGTKGTGMTTLSTPTKKSIFNSGSGDDWTDMMTLSEWLDALAELQEVSGDEILQLPLVWSDKDGNAHPVRFEPMSGRVRNGRFVLDEPANMLCVN